LASRRYPYYVLGLVVLANMCAFATRSVVYSLHDPLVAEFGIGERDFGLMHSVFVWTFALAAVVWAVVADRCARRRILALGMFLWGLGCFASAAAPQFTTLLWARGLVGFAQAVGPTAGVALLMEWFERGRRARAIGAFSAAMVAGAGAGYFVGGYFASHEVARAVLPWAPWRTALVLIGLPGIPLAILLATVRDSGRGPSRRGPASLLSRQGWVELSQVVRRRSLLCVVGADTSFCFGMAVLQVFGPAFLQQHRGYAIGATPAWELIAGGAIGVLSGGLGFWCATWIVDRTQTRRPNVSTVCGAAGGAVLGPLLLLLILGSTKGADLLLLVPTAFFMAWQGGLAVVATQALAPVHLTATTLGFLALSNNLVGEASGAWAAGAVSDAQAGSMEAALLLAPAAMLACSGLFLLASRTAGDDVATIHALEQQAEQSAPRAPYALPR